MIVYNITIKIDPAIETAWLQWQKNEHIPEIMASGYFTGTKFFHLLEQDESEGITYVVQYTAATLDDYHNYIKAFAAALREKALAKWGNRFIAFRTVMEIVN